MIRLRNFIALNLLLVTSALPAAPSTVEILDARLSPTCSR